MAVHGSQPTVKLRAAERFHPNTGTDKNDFRLDLVQHPLPGVIQGHVYANLQAVGCFDRLPVLRNDDPFVDRGTHGAVCQPERLQS